MLVKQRGKYLRYCGLPFGGGVDGLGSAEVTSSTTVLGIGDGEYAVASQLDVLALLCHILPAITLTHIHWERIRHQDQNRLQKRT